MTAGGYTSYNTYTRRGNCKACKSETQWSKVAVASHKRVNCPAATEKEKNKFAIKNTDFVAFEISEYLENFNKKLRAGNCKSCSKKVQWSRQGVASHKRCSCTNVSVDDKKRFYKDSSLNSTNITSTVSTRCKNRTIFNEQYSNSSNNSTNEISTSISNKNCYLCKIFLDALRSPLDNFLKFTKTTVYQYLGKHHLFKFK